MRIFLADHSLSGRTCTLQRVVFLIVGLPFVPRAARACHTSERLGCSPRGAGRGARGGGAGEGAGSGRCGGVIMGRSLTCRDALRMQLAKQAVDAAVGPRQACC